jgi:photosystem II stability/assembly factor-like uncharacterized protein
MRKIVATLVTLFCHRAITLILCLLILSANCVGQWRQKFQGTDTTNGINGIYFLSPSSGFAAFDKYIGFTSDSGQTFTKLIPIFNNTNFNGYSVNLTFGFTANGVYAFTKDSVIAYGHYGLEPSILFSSNGGQNWKVVFHQGLNPNDPLGSDGVTSMAFIKNSSTGFALHHEQILKTFDRGSSWQVVLNAPGYELRKLNFPSSTTGYATGGNHILKTSDGGNTWTALPLPSAANGDYNNIHFLNDNTGYLSRYDNGLIFRTDNGGASWVQMNDPDVTAVQGTEIYFTNDSTGYLTSTYLYEVFKTSDRGKTWELCARNNNSAFHYFGLRGLFFYNEQIGWVGGYPEFLMITTNGGGQTLPHAYFKIDTSGVANTGQVHLVNYSRKEYQSQWYRNGRLSSTGYSTTYTHDPFETRDTIMLIVTNPFFKSDTAIDYVSFDPTGLIESFSPTSGPEGTVVSIKGTHFSATTNVFFGGVQAERILSITDTLVRAIVGKGASGDVSIVTASGSARKPGFIFIKPPQNNLPLIVTRRILCKTEPLSVSIGQTEQFVEYILVDSLGRSHGSGFGNGSNLSFNSDILPNSMRLRIKASRTNYNSFSYFPDTLAVTVEHTTSRFIGSKLNITPQETLNFAAQSYDAATYQWIFNEDASLSASNDTRPSGIFYATTGTKTLTLISTSAHGCRDTVTTTAVSVYDSQLNGNKCYAQNIQDSTIFDGSQPPPIVNPLSLCPDNGFILSGTGNSIILKSRTGIAPSLPYVGAAYIAKYTNEGVIKWMAYSKGKTIINASAVDGKGNIYIVGQSFVFSYMYFPNGDSLRLAATPDASPNSSNKWNGFVVKLDADGNYLWHGTFNDPNPEFAGYRVWGAIPTKLAISSDQLVITGRLFENLSYRKGAIEQNFLNLQNSTSPRDLQNNFIMSLDTSGAEQWFAYMQNNATNDEYDLTGIGIDENNNAYISGYHEQKVQIHDAKGTTINFVNEGYGTSSYLLKFDPSGRIAWKTRMVHPTVSSSFQINDIATDLKGNSYLTGLCASQDYTLANVISSDGSVMKTNLKGYCLLKFDANGMCKWITGSETAGGSGYSVTLKGSLLYATGVLWEPSAMSVSTLLTSADGINNYPLTTSYSEFFITSQDTLGNLVSVASSGNNTGQLIPNQLLLDANNRMLISGLTHSINTTYSVFQSSFTPMLGDGFFATVNSDLCETFTLGPAFAGPDRTICIGDTAGIGRANKGGNFSWTSMPAGLHSALPNPAVRPKVSTTFFLEQTSPQGQITRDTVSITVRAAPVTHVSLDTTLCSAYSITLGDSAVTGYTYSWISSPHDYNLNSTASHVTVHPTYNSAYVRTVSDSTCTAKDTMHVTLTPMNTPIVSIRADRTLVCSGSDLVFTAGSGGQGPSPHFQWYRNSFPVGTDSSFYKANDFKNLDTISVRLFSSAGCLVKPDSLSNKIIVQITPVVTPDIAINGGTILPPGFSTLVSSQVTNGGASPSFSWQDSSNASGWKSLNGNQSTISYKPLIDGASVRCIMTSNATCTSRAKDTSNTLVFHINVATALPPALGGDYGITGFPNPVNNLFTLDHLKLTDKWEWVEIMSIDGKERLIVASLRNRQSITIGTTQLAQGLYIAILSNQKGEQYFLRFLKL